MNIKCSETEKNLYKTFAGECRARNKYYLYAEKAKSEGYLWIAKIFEEIGDNEFAHAREAFKRYLNKVSSTKNNLIESALGEAEESSSTYREFEKKACEEGLDEIADFFKELREVEESHKERFLKLAKDIKEDKIFKYDDYEKCLWKCMNCGYIYEGNKAPEKCPLCRYPKSYFKKLEEEKCE